MVRARAQSAKSPRRRRGVRLRPDEERTDAAQKRACSSPEATLKQTTPADGQVEVRTYWGRDQAEASAQFQIDAIELAANGYRPTSQVWTGRRRLSASS